MELKECIRKNVACDDQTITSTGYLDLSGYAHPLPAGITRTGSLYLDGYAHPLPAGIKK